jgi:hypothetical protein
MTEGLKLILTRTTEACPTQWEGETDDGRKVYARYRFGHLEVRTARHVDDPLPMTGGNRVLSEDSGHNLEGYMSDSELAEKLKRSGWEVEFRHED